MSIILSMQNLEEHIVDVNKILGPVKGALLPKATHVVDFAGMLNLKKELQANFYGNRFG